jgi:hypothetical protein
MDKVEKGQWLLTASGRLGRVKREPAAHSPLRVMLWMLPEGNIEWHTLTWLVEPTAAQVTEAEQLVERQGGWPKENGK